MKHLMRALRAGARSLAASLGALPTIGAIFGISELKQLGTVVLGSLITAGLTAVVTFMQSFGEEAIKSS